MINTQNTIESIRTLFPVTRKLIYFDHAAVAPIHLKTVEAVNCFMEDLLSYGDRNYKQWHLKSEEIRSGMAEFIGANPEEIAFIKNTSQGLSLVASGLDFKEGDNVVIPDVEFPANIYPWLNLERKGVNVKFINTSGCEIPINCIEAAIDQNTKIVSISSVEFSTGYRNDLKSISQLCARKSEEYGRKIYLCVDAIQSLGVFKLDVKELGIDFLSADGHKWFLTPEGAGIFYCKESVLPLLHPVSVGWKSVKDPLNFSNIKFDLQDSARKFEEGSLNMAGVIALGASLELFNEFGIENIEKRILNITRRALEALQSRGYKILSPLDDKQRSGIISFEARQNVEEEYKNFIDNNIQISIRDAKLRISPHFYNTEEEVEQFKGLLRE
jgi:selenocysteine lyase/cysteine desulfurase